MYVIKWILSMIACTNQFPTTLPGYPAFLNCLFSAAADWIGLTNELPRPTVIGASSIVKCCSYVSLSQVVSHFAVLGWEVVFSCDLLQYVLGIVLNCCANYLNKHWCFLLCLSKQISPILFRKDTLFFSMSGTHSLDVKKLNWLQLSVLGDWKTYDICHVLEQPSYPP